ncbi:MAG: N-acetylmuramoyl-L-alanine amidase-like domain-containing protein [Pseudobdellovibrionaceae bacterium]|jgi:hypothetical protein
MNRFLFCLLFIVNSFPFMAGAQLSSQDIAERVDLFSSDFLGEPYLKDPLGEGSGKDSDPLYRFDGFDCTTFVETVMALAISLDDREFENNMNRIRYKQARILFSHRNHFTDADWIPNNVKNGLLKDITHQLMNGRAYTAATTIQRSRWFAVNHGLNINLPTEKAEVPFIPKEWLLANKERIKLLPHGSIVNIVRPNWQLEEKIGTNLNVSHQGFIIHKEDGVYFRHASQTALKVVDELFLDYLNKMNSNPTIGGINVLEILKVL